VNDGTARVDTYKLLYGETAFVESRGGDGQAKRITAHNRTEVAAGAQQPASLVATPRQFRQLHFRFESETRRGSHRTFCGFARGAHKTCSDI